MKTFAFFASLAGLAAADILWDGRFNDLKSAKDLENWSWSNQVGPYQYYIHGDGDVSEYVALSADYANPADSGSSQGAKISLTDTAYWDGQTMRRTELIPQTSAAIAAGKVFYHFSIKRASENAPSTAREHQIAFFESHFTELKSGGDSGSNLGWFVGGTSKWEVEWAAGEWHNMAYEIDFDAKTVGLWHSTGASALKQVVAPVTASTSSNGADWHVGVLELANGDADKNEDFFFSGVYIENGDMTTSVSGPGGSSSGNDSSSNTSVASAAASTAPTSKSSSSVAVPTTQLAAVSTTQPVATKTTLVTSASVTSTTALVSQAISTAQKTSEAQSSATVPVSSTSSESVRATPTQKTGCKAKRRVRRRRS